MKKFLGVIAVSLLIGACGDDDDDTPDAGPTPVAVEDDKNDHWNRHFLPDGSFVWCLTSDARGSGQEGVRGMSCDWVDYHQRTDVLGDD